MEQNNISLNAEAIRAIKSLQAKNGTYHYYKRALKRLTSLVLNHGDEVGMSDTEALATLRAIEAIRLDLTDIAGTVAKIPDVDAEISEADLQAIANFFDKDEDDADDDADDDTDDDDQPIETTNTPSE